GTGNWVRCANINWNWKLAIRYDGKLQMHRKPQAILFVKRGEFVRKYDRQARFPKIVFQQVRPNLLRLFKIDMFARPGFKEIGHPHHLSHELVKAVVAFTEVQPAILYRFVLARLPKR